MTFLTSLPVLQPCQRSSTLSSAAFSSCSWFVKCEPSRNEYITLSMWKNTSCKTSEKSLPGAENFHLTLEISRAKLHDHIKSLSKGDESLGHIWNQNFPTRSLFFFFTFLRLGHTFVRPFNYFQRWYSLLPIQPYKRQGWENSRQRKESLSLLLFKKRLFPFRWKYQRCVLPRLSI